MNLFIFSYIFSLANSISKVRRCVRKLTLLEVTLPCYYGLLMFSECLGKRLKCDIIYIHASLVHSSATHAPILSNVINYVSSKFWKFWNSNPFNLKQILVWLWCMVLKFGGAWEELQNSSNLILNWNFFLFNIENVHKSIGAS